MASLEDGAYEFRNQAGELTPRGLSNFPNWARMMIGTGGNRNVRPADIDFTLQHRPFHGHQWEGALIGEFKPSGWGDLGYAQSGILEWCGKQANSYGLYIEDRESDLRTKSKYDEEQMECPYKITIYNNGTKKVYYRNLNQLNDALDHWWDTGILEFDITSK